MRLVERLAEGFELLDELGVGTGSGILAGSHGEGSRGVETNVGVMTGR